MLALVQRVSRASVAVGGQQIAAIDAGLLALACALPSDDDAAAAKLAERIARLRIMSDEGGKMNRSLIDTGGACLVVSAFTLAADASTGRRPFFGAAAPPKQARELCASLAHELRALGIAVSEGQFGADMQVALVNDGPVALLLDSC